MKFFFPNFTSFFFFIILLVFILFQIEIIRWNLIFPNRRVFTASKNKNKNNACFSALMQSQA